MTKGALFDKDGTLFDFEATWFPVMQDILGILETRFRVTGGVLADLRSASGMTETGFVRDSLVQSATTSETQALWRGILSSHGITAKASALAEVFNRAVTGPAFSARTVPGAEALLKRLRERGYRLGVVTADDRSSTEHGLRQAGLLGYFDYIAADGDGSPTKPDPWAAADFCRSFGIEASAVTMVGDSAVDMEFARNAGARFIGMKTSCNDYSRFTAARCPVIENFLDIETVERLLA